MNGRVTGLLLNDDILLQRQYFEEMLSLYGIEIIYRVPRESKEYDKYGEIDTNYKAPESIFCILNEHPDIRTMRKLGWNSESNDSPVLISVAYDTPGLQRGCLVSIPDTFNPKVGRLFRIDELSAPSIIYPCAITCKLIPELQNKFNKSQLDYSDSDFKLLKNSEEEI